MIEDEESVVELVMIPEVEVGDGSSVGRWPACHSIVPPASSGRLAMGVMTGGAEKATVMDSDSAAQVHWSPLVMVVGLEVSLQATLCFVISRFWDREWEMCRK